MAKRFDETLEPGEPVDPEVNEAEEGEESGLPTRLPKHLDPEAGIDKSGVIRRFKDVDIQARIDAALATLPPETRGAVLAYADNDGAKLAIMGKKELWSGDLAWTVVAAKPYDGPFEAEAAVRYTW